MNTSRFHDDVLHVASLGQGNRIAVSGVREAECGPRACAVNRLLALNGTAAAAAPAAAQPAARAWAAWSQKQDWHAPDRADSAQLNRADWYATHHYSQPYPGDRRVLIPDEVPGADKDGDAPEERASSDDKH